MKLRKIVVLSVVALAAMLILSLQAFSASPPGPFFATLDGHSEIPDADPDGAGSFTALIDGTEFCYGLTVANIETPIGAHVHRGNAGENGDIVIHLAPPPSSGDPGSSSDCVTVSQGLLDEIQRNPSQFYVNVHTGPFPGGAVRGQLTRSPR